MSAVCQTEHPLEVGLRAHVGAAHLNFHELSGKRHGSDVVTGRSLHSHNIADGQLKVGGVAVKALAGVLELHLDNVAVGHSAGNVGEPVVALEFSAGHVKTAAAATRGAAGATVLLRLRISLSLIPEGSGITVFSISIGRGYYFAMLTERVSRITVILT